MGHCPEIVADLAVDTGDKRNLLSSRSSGRSEKGNKTVAEPMICSKWLFDLPLALLLLWLAWRLLSSPDLFKAVVLFIAFGLLMAVAWVRLHAIDVALAEAAIGAGVTGALFLSAINRMNSKQQKTGEDENDVERRNA